MADADYRKELAERKRTRLLDAEANDWVRRTRASAQFQPPAFFDSLEDEVAQPEEEIIWTVEGLHEAGTNTTLTASYKTGKTTLVMNLIRALADHEPFMGVHATRELSGRVGFWNYEVTKVKTVRDFRAMGIKNLSQVSHVPLRGHAVDILSEVGFEWNVEQLKRLEIEVWIIDPFSGAYYGDENSNTDQAAFTKRVDEIKELTGVQDVVMPVHTGRGVEEGKERARGGTKLDDWADNRWVLSRNKDDVVFFRSDWGRGERMEERATVLDRATNILTYSPIAGTRHQHAQNGLRDAILAYVRVHPGCTTNKITKDKNNGITGDTNEINRILKSLIDDCEVETRPGPNRSTYHYIYGTAPTP